MKSAPSCMLAELLQLAKDSRADGEASAEFIARSNTEALIGKSNVIPLIAEILLGGFRPKLFGERKIKPVF